MEREEGMKKMEQNIQELWNSDKRCNLCIMEMPEGKERKEGTEETFEVIIAEKFPKLMTDTKPYIQKAQKTPSRINTKKSTLHISYSNCRKSKKILKEPRGQKYLTYRVTRIIIVSDFPTEAIKARREWSEIFKVLKEKKYQPRFCIQ
uniref:L1 transposable element RRM domain-containing protein n=1 Tax=Equus caballus TaxID=9796 RepID=A0A9L0SD25_HORSE